MEQFVGIFRKEFCQFLFFFNLLFIENLPQFIEGMLGIPIDLGQVNLFFCGRNRSLTDGRMGRGRGIVFSTWGKARYKTVFVVGILLFLQGAGVGIGYAYVFYIIIRFILDVFHGERARCQVIRICTGRTVNDAACEMGVICYIDLETAIPSVDACLIRYAGVVAVHAALAEGG